MTCLKCFCHHLLTPTIDIDKIDSVKQRRELLEPKDFYAHNLRNLVASALSQGEIEALYQALIQVAEEIAEMQRAVKSDD